MCTKPLPLTPAALADVVFLVVFDCIVWTLSGNKYLIWHLLEIAKHKLGSSRQFDRCLVIVVSFE